MSDDYTSNNLNGHTGESGTPDELKPRLIEDGDRMAGVAASMVLLSIAIGVAILIVTAAVKIAIYWL